jgi:hypothetical protein
MKALRFMTAYSRAGPVAAVAVLASGCTAAGPTTPVSSAATAETSACSYDLRRDILPVWARSGFSNPSPSGIPFVLGEKGNIVGVIFGYPLTAPPLRAGRANKILWVVSPAVDQHNANRDGATSDDLKIDARLVGSTDVAHREVHGGPGPSIVDMPLPGCWHFTLMWSNRTDTLDLRYEARSE